MRDETRAVGSGWEKTRAELLVRLLRHALPAGLGIVADIAYGEPPVEPHPVAVFGSAMDHVERRIYRDSRAAGAVYTGVGLALGVVAGTLGRSTAAATGLAVAQRGLGEAASAVAAALTAGDLPLARERITALVGRDPSQLDQGELARAAVESVAENTVDAIVAPALWGAAFGARGALGYRAVNTMDAMVGHHSDRYEHFGWASARLDDAAAWVPARVTAALVAGLRPHRAAAVLAAVRDDAPGHPSPNAGVAEAAFAAALGIRLGGTNTYGDRTESRPQLGSGRRPAAADIDAAVALSRQVAVALAAGLVVVGVRGRRRR